MLNSKDDSGYVLPYLLVSIVLITTLLVVTVNLFLLYGKYETKKYNKKKLDLACYSAVQKFIAKDTLNFTQEQRVITDSISTALVIKQKGLYYSVTATAKNKKDSSKVEYLLADQLTEPFYNALIISRSSFSGIVTGNTKITGNILATTDKIKKGRIVGVPAAKDNYLTGVIKTSPILFPKLYKDTTLVQNFINWVKPKSKRTVTLLESTSADKDFITRYDTVESIIVKGNLTLYGEITGLSNAAKRIYVTGKTLIAPETQIKCNLEVYCDSTVYIKKKATLENVLITAKSKIVIEPGVVCKNVQLISQREIECNGTVTKFPSVICLYVNPGDTSKQRSKLSIKNKSKINGTVMLLSSEIAASTNKSKILIDSASTVHGVVYSENNVEAYGSILGALYTNNVLYYKKPTEYVNWLVDLKIDRTKLDKHFLIPTGFSKKPQLEILKETWVN